MSISIFWTGVFHFGGCTIFVRHIWFDFVLWTSSLTSIRLDCECDNHHDVGHVRSSCYAREGMLCYFALRSIAFTGNTSHSLRNMKQLLPLFLIPLGATGMVTSDVTRSRLSEAFLSPSGKLTLSPEIVIPEPTDPTAILLQTNAVQTLSSRIRACKANAAFLQGSVNALATFSAEQETARGNFPGPIPIIFCLQGSEFDLGAIAESGADGVMIPVCSGNEIENLAEIATDSTFTDTCKAAWACGLQPIPEVTVGQKTASTWSEQDFENMVAQLSEATGNEPVTVLLTVNPIDEEQVDPVTLPTVPKALGRKVPILGSVRVTAGENRLGAETNRFKEDGFTGALLRSDCVPGFRMQPDLEIVSQFWAACISDLKSTKSKSFSFRSKNNMEKNVMTQWGNYQKSVVESGALGDPDESFSALDEQAGDYKGFA
jgi:hypothetical protein